MCEKVYAMLCFLYYTLQKMVCWNAVKQDLWYELNCGDQRLKLPTAEYNLMYVIIYGTYISYSS